MGSDKRSPGSINTDLMASRPLRGWMKKFIDVLSILIVLHLRLSSVGAFVDF